MPPDETYHPVLEHPYLYRVRRLTFVSPTEEDEGRLDLALDDGPEGEVALRFHGPVNLEIEAGFPQPTGGMLILDVRDRQLDGIGVSVVDREASHGTLTFLARDVERLPGDAPTEQAHGVSRPIRCQSLSSPPGPAGPGGEESD